MAGRAFWCLKEPWTSEWLFWAGPFQVAGQSVHVGQERRPRSPYQRTLLTRVRTIVTITLPGPPWRDRPGVAFSVINVPGVNDALQLLWRLGLT